MTDLARGGGGVHLRPEANAELIARAKQDRAAFAEIYDLYLRRVFAFCVGHSRTREEAEDLTAQTFERALGAIARYEDRGVSFSAWLLRIAANLAANATRCHKRASGSGSSEWSAYDSMEGEQAAADHWVEDWELALWLRTYLGALPRDHQRVIYLRFYEDRTLRDVAEQMERSEDAVKQLLRRALARLRAHIEQEALSDV